MHTHRFAEGFDLNVQDPVAHKHIPYVVILVKMADEWAKSHGGRLPSTREEKKEFKVCCCKPFHLLLFYSSYAISFGCEQCRTFLRLEWLHQMKIIIKKLWNPHSKYLPPEELVSV
jgi:hypothetical protein